MHARRNDAFTRGRRALVESSRFASRKTMSAWSADMATEIVSYSASSHSSGLIGGSPTLNTFFQMCFIAITVDLPQRLPGTSVLIACREPSSQVT